MEEYDPDRHRMRHGTKPHYNINDDCIDENGNVIAGCTDVVNRGGYQGGGVVTGKHNKFLDDKPDWYKEDRKRRGFVD